MKKRRIKNYQPALSMNLKSSEEYMKTETNEVDFESATELTLVETKDQSEIVSGASSAEPDAPTITEPTQAAKPPLQNQPSNYTPLSKLKSEDTKMNQPALKTISIDTSDLDESKSEEMIALEQLICKIDPAEDRIATSISRASTNEGNLKTPDGIKIDGTLKGDITIINVEGYEDKHGTVFVNETGKVEGNIKGKRIVIAGEVHGNVTSATQLVLTPTGRVYGDLNYNQLIVLQNAEHEGTNKRLTREEVLQLLQPLSQ